MFGLNAPVPAPAAREEEAIYVIPSDDRVTVIFSTVFREETDKVFAKVFLQEFYDARRLPSIQSAPQVLYSNREPPAEIRHIPGLSSDDNIGYVTFGETPEPSVLLRAESRPIRWKTITRSDSH